MLADEREIKLVQRAAALDIGFIAMKAMAGGLIRRPDVTFAFLRQYPQVVPIYGIQRMEELRQWLSLENAPPRWDEEMQHLAAEEKASLGGDFSPKLRLLYALSHGHRDPQCRPYVALDDPLPL